MSTARLAVTLDPRASSRTLTLREFARLLGPVAVGAGRRSSDPVERMRGPLSAAVGNRGLVPVPTRVTTTSPTRTGQSRAHYERAADEIDAALQVVLDRLAPGGAQPV